ncbi:heparinase II/III family protein [Gorillibacterium sp. CAU 1737]|uniref:heparinase II/III family protein n=1 Tax=Gorillibacterium sp. CAU 1737 TaxID=3140362 RepID=UPI0032615EB0
MTSDGFKLENRVWGPFRPAGRRLYGSEEEWEAFRRAFREEDAFREEREELLQEGARLLNSPAPVLSYARFALFAERGSRLEYERVYFEQRRRMNTFALLALLLPDHPNREEHRAALLESLWSVCSEFTWCLPAHVDPARSFTGEIDLFAAETGFSLAELSVLLGDQLPPFLRARMEELVEERLFRPFLEGGPYGWEEAEHNWSAVCAGSLGSAALLLLKDENRLRRILLRTEKSMSAYLRGFDDDGACLEGLGYWNYGFGYFVYYADLLDRRTSGERNWFHEEKVKRIAGFQQVAFLGGRAAVNFSDADPFASVSIGLSHYLANKLPNVQAPPASLRAPYTEDACSRWAPAFRSLLWKSRSTGETDWPPGSWYLPDARWWISRVHTRAGTFGFAAKGGHNGEPHNHNDLGHFLIVARGEVLLADLGCGEYTRDYFGEGRYAYACNGSQGHSVPIMNGQLQMPGIAFSAPVAEAVCGEHEDLFSVELAGAYPGSGVRSLKRTWRWEKEELPRLTLLDSFCSDDGLPVNLTERFVTRIPPMVEASGIRLMGKCGLSIRMTYDAERWTPEVTERTFRDHEGADAVWYTVDFHLREPQVSGEARFDFLYQESAEEERS